MSKESIHKIICNECKKEFAETISDSLNVSLDPESLLKVRNGDVVTVICPHCGKKMFYNHPVLYHDMNKHFMVQYAPDTKTLKEFIDATDTAINQFNSLFGQSIKHRVVLGDYRSFIEKVEILTAGYNDVIVEIYKETFFQEMNLDKVEHIYFDFSEDLSDKRLTVELENGKTDYYKINDEIYNDIDRTFKTEVFYDREEDYIVDRRFVHKMLPEDSNHEPIHIELLNELMEKECKAYHEEAIRLAKKRKLDEALELMLPLAEYGYDSAQNDLGVIYEMKKDYKNAAKWYLKDSSDNALINYLQLCDKHLIDFTVKEYFKACETLMEHKNGRGYLYVSYIHQNDYKGIQNHTKAFEILLEGLINCNKNKDAIVFELGYLLEIGIGHEVDHYKSHKCYEAVLNTNINYLFPTINYNYALQCYYGKGCEKDMEKAIKYFAISAEKNYKDAITHLIEIYSSKEYYDEERLKYYKNKS